MTRSNYPRELFGPGEPHESRTDPGLSFWLGRLRIAEPQRADALEVWPLLIEGEARKPLVLLHQALAAGTIEVLEQGGGSVNQVVARNHGAVPVLVLEGEAIVGAKQNRAVVETVLIGAGQTVSVPVGCVQHGRWSASWGKFDIAPLPVDPSIRKHTVMEAAAAGHVNQARLWADVAASLSSLEIRSTTADYYEGIEVRHRAAVERARVFESLPGQLGALVLASGGLLGLEIVGHPESWAALARRTLPSYVLAADAAAREPRGGAEAPRHRATEWLAAVAAAEVRVRPSRGLGTQLAIAGQGFTGAGLWHEGRPAHLVVFPG